MTLGIDGKLQARSFEELKEGDRPSSPLMIQEALRLPNISLKDAALSISGT